MTYTRWFILAAAILVIGAIATYYSYAPAHSVPPAPVTYGMSEYTDAAYGFSFWYPNTLPIAVASNSDTLAFPGGTNVEIVTVGPTGTVSAYVVDSPTGTITDEPNGHASPIAQTKYFYDSTTGVWMRAFPEGNESGGPSATTTADTSKQTIGGLPMLTAGRRFDTTIIPLSTTRFLVISDGGGSSFTPQLTATVALTGMAIAPATLSAALQAESAAFANQ